MTTILDRPAPNLPTARPRDMLAFLSGYIASAAKHDHALGPQFLAEFAMQIDAYLQGSLDAYAAELARETRFSLAAAAVAAAARGDAD